MIWTRQKLLDTLQDLRVRRGDTTSIEVKRATGGLPKMAETLCAFANMPNGGTVILGVDEAAGAFDVVGVSDSTTLAQGLTDMARQAVEPAPHLEFEHLTIDDKSILVAQVLPLRIADRPARTGGRAYLRQADGDYPMHEHEIRMVEISKLHIDERIDQDLAPAKGRSEADLVPELVEKYLTAVRKKDPRMEDQPDGRLLQLTNVLAHTGEPTLAGLYALGEYPQGHYPALTVTAAVQLPPDERGGGRTRNLRDFSGPLPTLLDDIMEWCGDNLDTIHRYRDDGHMEITRDLPLPAVRELVANALVHRDLGPTTLGTGKQVQIRVTPDKLFIQSPGGLRGVALAQLESIEHAQAAVNQRLYQIAKRLTTADGAALIEGEGGGIREVFRIMDDRGLRPPHLVDTGVQFNALLWRPRGEGGTPPIGAGDHAPRKKQAGTAAHDAGPRTTPAPSTSGDEPLPRCAEGSPTGHAPRRPRNSKPVLDALWGTPEGLPLSRIAELTDLNVSQVRYVMNRLLAEGLAVMDGGQGKHYTRYRPLTEPGPTHEDGPQNPNDAH